MKVLDLCRKIFEVNRIVFIVGILVGTIACQPQAETSKPKLKLGISAPKGELQKVSGKAQGTTYHISYYSPNKASLKGEVDSLLQEIDNSVSTWNQSSLITELNNSKDNETSFDEYNLFFSENFKLARKVWTKTNGALDPTLGPLINAWGFGFEEGKVLSDEEVNNLLPLVGFSFENVRLSKKSNEVSDKVLVYYKKYPEMTLSFNAFAQGYSVDKLAELFDLKGIKSYMIELGGELITKGVKTDGEPWKIAIDKPEDNPTERAFQAVVRVVNKALVTSGNYRKFYIKDGVKYAHTIDPVTGKPVQHSLLSATVLADNCGYADAYATAFMVMGLEKTKKFLAENKELGLEVYLVFNKEGKLETYISEGFKSLLVEN